MSYTLVVNGTEGNVIELSGVIHFENVGSDVIIVEYADNRVEKCGIKNVVGCYG